MSDAGEIKSNTGLADSDTSSQHFDPYAGLIDLQQEKTRDIQYGLVICGYNLLLDKTLICEVVQNKIIYPVPNTPNWVKGLINLRGSLTPVFNLYSYWKIENRPEQQALIIVGEHEDAFGIFTDCYPKAINMEQKQDANIMLPNSAPAELKRYLSKGFHYNNEDWFHMDMTGFIKEITYQYADNENNQTL